MFVVFVDVTEFDGNCDGAVGFVLFISIKGTARQVFKLVLCKQVAVGEVGVAVSEANVEVPMAGDRTVVVESDADISTNAVVETVLGVDSAVVEDADIGVSSKVGFAAPSGVVLLVKA